MADQEGERVVIRRQLQESTTEKENTELKDTMNTKYSVIPYIFAKQIHI